VIGEPPAEESTAAAEQLDDREHDAAERDGCADGLLDVQDGVPRRREQRRTEEQSGDREQQVRTVIRQLAEFRRVGRVAAARTAVQDGEDSRDDNAEDGGDEEADLPKSTPQAR